MKILKDAGTFEVLNKDTLLDQLLQIERAGRTCYQSEKDAVTQESAAKFVKRLIKSGHHSVLEHSNISVKFDNVSRGFTHEMVRHRIAAFSQESTRYVDYAKEGSEGVDLDRFQLKCVVPPHRDEKAVYFVDDYKLPISLEDMFETCEGFYRTLRKAGWAPEDARQILPIGIKSQIVVSANFREWRHIFSLRTSKYAHWEIRGVMIELLKHVKREIPGIFDDFSYGGVDKNGQEYAKMEAQV